MHRSAANKTTTSLKGCVSEDLTSIAYLADWWDSVRRPIRMQQANAVTDAVVDGYRCSAPMYQRPCRKVSRAVRITVIRY